jgi:hypothetical protein
MEERLKFIARLLEGEKMAGLCRGPASRAASYKLLSNACGDGLGELQFVRRQRYRHFLPQAVVVWISASSNLRTKVFSTS